MRLPYRALLLSSLSFAAMAQQNPGPGQAPGGGSGGGMTPDTPFVATGTDTGRASTDRGSSDQINALDKGVSTGATDNFTALQSAINLAVSTGRPLFLPAAAPGTCYKYTPPLVINGDMTLNGAWVTENWNGGINVPLGNPPLNGAVLCPVANGADAIDITGASRGVGLKNFGILFQTPLTGSTGDAIHYVPAINVQGLSGAYWENVKVYGHDGNHYAFNLTNPIYNTIVGAFAYGGGGFKITGNANTGGLYGNTVFIHPYTQVIVGGTAHGYNLSANSPGVLNLVTFIRPQVIIDQVAGTSPAGNPPTTAQLIWNQDTNARTIRVIHPDMETNIGAGMQMGTTGVGNEFDWAALIGDAGFINAPNWGQSGIHTAPRSFAFTDTTGTGTIPLMAMTSMTADTINAANPVTYTEMTNLIVGAPSKGTNVTSPTVYAIYAQGGIKANGAYSGALGAFINGGAVTLNKNNNNIVEIGDGSTTAQVTIGGGSNKVAIGSALQTGSVTPLTLTTGEIGMTKIAASASAPGAAGLKLAVVCGTNAGSAKIITYAGTSTTAVTLLDNIGAGVTGC